MGRQGVQYRVEGGWGALTVEEGGMVRLWKALDRDAPGGDKGLATIIATDEGSPPLSSTATLSVTVNDINDSPPYLLPPTTLRIEEEVPASLLGTLRATDDDIWQLGHGPPFTFSLAPSNPPHVTRALTLRYIRGADSGRGGAEVWTTGPLDREKHRQLTLEVEVRDAGGVAASHPVTVLLGDVNDNPMKTGHKTVYVWKTQGSGTESDLGRVYVEDPDDCDLEDKRFRWASAPHPLFSLHTRTGQIRALTTLREARYELEFSVSDVAWDQHNVRARKGGGGLGTLTEAVKKVLGSGVVGVEVVSVHGPPQQQQQQQQHPNTHTSGNYTNTHTSHSHKQHKHQSIPPSSSSSSSSSPVHPPPPTRDGGPHTPTVESPRHSQHPPTPYACVWLSVREGNGDTFMDPVKLRGLLGIHLPQIEDAMKLQVSVEDLQTIDIPSSSSSSSSISSSSSSSFTPDPHAPSYAASSLASVALPLQVVDANTTSLVTPLLPPSPLPCHPHHHHHHHHPHPPPRPLLAPTCTTTTNTCLNGGRCLHSRCVCPGGSWGPRCKVLSRTFQGAGWVWVPGPAPCLPTKLSLRLLLRRPSALLLYSGPLSPYPTRAHRPHTPMLALQVVGGRPEVVVEGVRGSLRVEVNTTLNLDVWHTLHLHLTHQGVSLMVDLCGVGWSGKKKEKETTLDHCLGTALWPSPDHSGPWVGGGPLQVGGLAHPHPHAHQYGWTHELVHHPLSGCVSHLTLNTELVDLGEAPHSGGSERGCGPQNSACGGGCGVRGDCVGGLLNPSCRCQPGWTGPRCEERTSPVGLGKGSYASLPLPLIPDPYTIRLQVRVRARGRPHGLVIQLGQSYSSRAVTLWLHEGTPCAGMSGEDVATVEVCLEDVATWDGTWRTLFMSRHGHNLLLSLLDDGDNTWRHNESLATLDYKTTTPVSRLSTRPHHHHHHQSSSRPSEITSDSSDITSRPTEITRRRPSKIVSRSSQLKNSLTTITTTTTHSTHHSAHHTSGSPPHLLPQPPHLLPPPHLLLDRVRVGGIPENEDATLTEVRHDLHDCK
ncbi:hypothetical protein Pmani_036772 [Petrolisthes manimaculis]|uniref:Neural-cadherin n=1 Tax=Petrolisthes manimaculis TaxID=1843537 RepID=A0AAE1NHN6_9EUCA|nr:hypothetical protein Pmani_036772 [Petrolisthes manimaculis]